MLEVNIGAKAVKSLHRKRCLLSSFFRVNERERSLAAKVFLCELQLLCLFLNASMLEKKGNDSLRGSGLDYQGSGLVQARPCRIPRYDLDNLTQQDRKRLLFTNLLEYKHPFSKFPKTALVDSLCKIFYIPNMKLDGIF